MFWWFPCKFFTSLQKKSSKSAHFVFCAFITLLFAPSKPKLIDRTVHNQCLNFVENWDFSQFWSKMVQFSISQETLRADFAEKNWLIFSPKMSKEALWAGPRRSCNLYLNNRILQNSGPLKIRLLQCYVVLWIHNIDAICMDSLWLWFLTVDQFWHKRSVN